MPDTRFSRSQRLTSSDIRTLFAHGKKVGDDNVLLIYQRKPPSDNTTIRDCNKLGITISTKVSKRAFIRNRVKRLFREVFRKNNDLFPTPYYYLFIKRSIASELSYNSILGEVKAVLKKIKN
ncbi:MAG: ribonuclease P protein component [Candidatus Omnitrophica bacterium]|nr:ribonuclease P protein component [Candidatus Omnitrophota bacterium]